MNLTLQTGPNRLDFLMRGERFTSYRYDTEMPPGFTALHAPGGRAVTRADDRYGLSLWLMHGNVEGIAFGPLSANALEGNSAAAMGRILSTEMTARRGSLSVGFRQTCAWIAPDNRTLLTEVRTVRVVPSAGDGRCLDLTLHLSAPEDRPVTLGRTEEAFLHVRVAASLCPLGGGQIRNAQGDYGMAELQGRSAAWCACVGVVEGETVGFVLLDHPDNLWHPPPWVAHEDGTLSPSPFAWRAVEMAPRDRLSLRYRLLVHRGYVEAGWADARLAEFAASRP